MDSESVRVERAQRIKTWIHLCARNISFSFFPLLLCCNEKISVLITASSKLMQGYNSLYFTLELV
ncbi:hypothetical protein OIU84_013181 [Salix udensis]|uniref:Uncharacterized protein n=1 Tax=Salix udensis TaxID=889485 RepID=A0AAD6JIN8_9ROSI|nr:hypothetical protein OIU84_013181 [Salix udensis]